MAHSSARVAPTVEKFSLPLFLLTVLTTLACLFAVLRFAVPAVWAGQFHHPAWNVATAFLAVSLVNCFIEFFFHRYVLHMPAVPFLRRLYRQHTLHHALTRIGRKPSPTGRGLLFVENKYPMIEPEQGEASFFPWYTLAVFAAALAPLLALLQWVLPSYPWFLAGYSALSVSMILYELLHALNHWPVETWQPLIEHRRWGWFWRPAYAFHLRHHAVIDCNESISGFFGLPLADWAFGTCVIPQTIYADGEDWSPEKFVSPRPRWLIRRLDALADSAVRRRRAAASAPDLATARAPRVYTTGEKIANWVSHGLGLGLSVAGLTLLIVLSSLRGNAWQVVSFTLFGLALLALYSISILHHARLRARAAGISRWLNRAAVCVLVAGTVTPFILAHLHSLWGWSLLLAGGLCYLVGLLIYRLRHMRYGHALWHTFVLGGSTCHLLVVLLFLLPRAA